jgi:hypothetical protein
MDWARGAGNALRTSRDYIAQKSGYHTGGELARAARKARGEGIAQGIKKAPDQLSTADLTSAAGKRLAGIAGKGLSTASEKVTGAMHTGAKALRKGMEDNPAGIAAAGIGAGLGALGLSKLLRRRRAPM